MTIGKALLTDGRVVRFRVLSQNPVVVRTVGTDAEPGEGAAIEAWFAEQGRGA
ncbi:MAG: hypothetical protein JO283_06060 [Bradyrhizobium sp.]|nr:hypothetical protein [Bradyrhizobium sp.]